MKNRLLTLALCATFAATPLLGSADLHINEKVAADGSSVDVEVWFTSDTNDVGALAFAIQYDTARLHFNSTQRTAGVLHNVELQVPPGFAATSLYLNGDQIGVTIYNLERPIRPIRSGRIATLHFETKFEAAGHAYVRIAESPQASAADLAGISVPLKTTAGGVTIVPRRGVATLSPQLLTFAAITAGGESETRLVHVTNTGTAALRLHELQQTGSPAFSIRNDALPVVLSPGSTNSIEVVFSPSTVGTFSGQLMLGITTQGISSNQIVAMRGEAVPRGSAVYPSRWVLPAVAKLPGSGGSIWLSTLVLSNRSDRAIEVQLTLFAVGEEAGLKTLTLPPQASVKFKDVAGELFSRDNISGYLVIESSSPDLVARSTTSNLQAGRELAQSVPVIEWERLFHKGDTAHLLDLRRSEGKRSNVALLNAGEDDAVLRVELRRADGSIVRSKDYLIPAHFLLQSIDIFEDDGDANLSASVSCASEKCTFFSFASTVDIQGTPVFQSAR